MEKQPITVVVMEDIALTRAGIRSILADHDAITIVGEGWVGEHLAPLMATHRPDVVLLDLQMPQYEDEDAPGKFHALPAVARLHKTYPETAFVIVSQVMSYPILEGGMEMGVYAYLLKSDAMSLQLAQAIRAAHNRGSFFSPAIGREILGRRKEEPANGLLTSRERQYLQVTIDAPNASESERAAILGIAESTYRNGLSTIYKKLGVDGKASCIIYCLRHGILQ